MAIETNQHSSESPATVGAAGGFAVPASAAQQRFWLVDQTSATRALYNTPVVYRLSGPLSIDALRRGFAGLVQRHESLRTTFAERDGVLMQCVAPTGTIPLRTLTAPPDPAVWRRAVEDEAAAPFDLARGPLMRAAVIQVGDDDHVLVITGHHVIFDGWSETVLFDDLEALYTAAASGETARLPELAIQYADFAVWQAQAVPPATVARAVDYWREQLRDLAPLDLPADRPRPRQSTMAGALREFDCPPATTAAIRALARRCGTTTFVVAAAAFQALLHRHTGQADIPVGIITSGRTRSEVEGLIGCFINTLVLRGDLSGDPSFLELVERMRQTVLDAHKHAGAPFERVVEALGARPDPTRHPLFQVLFNFSPIARPTRAFAGIRLERLSIDTGLSKFDLTLELADVGDELCGSFEYSTELFDAATIDRLVDHFQELLAGVARAPEASLSNLPILTAAEREQLMVGWHETPTEAPLNETVVALVAAQAARTPDAPAVVCGDDTLTYGEVRRMANRLARRLRIQHGVQPGARVGLSIERSAAMVPALFGILETGAAYVPLDPAYPADRLAFMREDAAVSVVVADRQAARAFEGTGVAIVHADDPNEPDGTVGETPSDASTLDALAYVMYTSGSTGRPKGAAITHRALSEHCQDVRRLYALTPADRVLQFASLNFDPSVEQIFSTLVSGACLVVRGGDVWSAAEFATETARHAVTVADLATAYWTQIAYAAADAPAPAGAASTLRLVMAGGEAMPVDALASWWRTPYAHARLLNTYGPTEATVTATAFEVTPAWQPGAGERVVPIGRPFGRRRARVLDPIGSLVPMGVVGELCLGGAGLATGYLNQPALTERAFISDPFDETPGARLYRTGDLVRYLPNGDLAYLGRRDEQVKINGFRIEPGEIEAALVRHPAVEQAIVAVRDDGGGPRLVAYVIAAGGRTVEPDDVCGAVAATLPDYMVPTAFVVLEEWPLTPNGKIDRKRLPAPAASIDRPARVAPRTETERQLAAIWADVLHVSEVGVHDSFFELGGHSLLAMRLAARISAGFGVDVPIRRLFELPTVAGLAEHLARPMPGHTPASRPAPPIVPRPRRNEPLAVSPVQRRFWFLDRWTPGTATYTIPAAYRLRGPLDAAALTASLNDVIARHESLRTTFEIRDDVPVQVVADTLTIEVPVIDAASHSTGASADAALQQLVDAQFRLPFDLTRGPLVRAALLRVAADEHVFVLAVHHIVFDGWSMDIFARDLATSYAARRRGAIPDLPEPALQYGDYAAWQQETLQAGALEESLAYWRDQLQGVSPLDLPIDHARAPHLTSRGGTTPLRVPSPTVSALEAVARQEGATLFMALVAVWTVLLSRYTRQEDIVVGTPISGRDHADTHDMIGCFVNTLALRTNLGGNPSFRETLARIREVAMGAYEHQDVPFDALVDALRVARDTSRTPLFDTLFAMQGPDGLTLEGLIVEDQPAHTGTAMFDLGVTLGAGTDGLVGFLGFRADLFEPATAERIARHYETLIAGAVENPDRPVAALPMLTALERDALIAGWHETPAEAPRDETVVALVAARAARTPEAPAVICGDETLTYGEVRRMANRLARRLRIRHGVRPGARVGLSVSRSAAMVPALLGILETGAAYVPLDPAYPADRLAFMREDADVSVIVTDRRAARVFENTGVTLVGVDDPLEPEGEAGEGSSDASTLDALAYVMYTSGSTGRPKGVAITHRALSEHCQDARRVYELTSRDRVLQFASLNFDSSAEQIFPTLVTGACLVVRGDIVWSAAEFANEMKRHGVTVAHLATAYWAQIAYAAADIPTPAGAASALRLVMVGGEAMPVDALAPWWRTPYAHARLLNTYGPTEATVTATMFEVTPSWRPAAGERAIPIGRPFGRRRARVLDPGGSLVPMGVVGELCLGGAGLAAGYLNQPALTDAAFLPDPFDDAPGARLYRTGDLVRYLPNGDLAYLGRRDQQVKINGFRIEPGEIETALQQHAAIQQAIVMLRDDGAGPRLAAYVIPAAGQTVEPDALGGFLAAALPDYMVPTAFVVLDAWPLTPNGKVDRKRLPAPAAMTSAAARVAPRTETERRLAALWAEVLNAPAVGVHDNFFDLGGHSLLAMRLAARISALFGVDVPIRRVFELPTVARLAEQLERPAVGSAPPTTRLARPITRQQRTPLRPAHE